jgi:F-type H+-transporting ATPase subunit delta
MIEKKKIIARRYAEAFFKTIENNNLEESFKDFEAFNALYEGYDGLAKVLLYPTIHLEKKIAMIKKIFGPSASQHVTNFICILIRRKRLNLFELIVQEVERLYRREHGIRGIVIKSAVPLLREEKIRLRAILALKFGRIEIREVVDPSVLGGLIIQFTDQVVDESIRHRLNQLKDLIVRVDNEWLLTLINQPSIAL